MKKIILFVCTLIILLYIPKDVFANECSTEIQNEYYSKINNIKYKFNYIEDNTYSIEFYNIPKDITIYDGAGIAYSNEIPNSYVGGKTYTFTYLVSGLDCEISLNTKKKIYIPKYNVYSERPECKLNENKDFKLCNETYQGTITDEVFEKELKKFNEKQIEINEVIEQDDNSKLNVYSYMLIACVGLGIIIIVFIIIFVIRKESGDNKW